MIDMRDVFQEVLESKRAEIKPLPLSQQIHLLETLSERMATPARFEKGNYVAQYPQLVIRPYPSHENPGIFVRYLDEVIYTNTTEPEAPDFMEPLDCVIGVVMTTGDGKGCYVELHVDSRRLDYFTPEPSVDEEALN